MNVAVVFPYDLWTKKMSFVRRDAVYALQQRPDVHVTVTGPGWMNWDDTLCMADNLDKEPNHFDAIWWYKPDRCIEPEKRACPAMVCYNESNWDDWKAFRECKASKADVVVIHHQTDIEQFRPPLSVANGYQPRQLHWMAHAADCEFFAKHSLPWSERDIDCLVTGVLSPEIYPLRCRMATMVRDGRLPGVVHNHPGYRLANLGACECQRERYAKMLGRSKIALVCSSIHRYGLAKYVEAAAAGCCVAGDVPPDFALTLGPAMLVLDDMSDEEIADKLGVALGYGSARDRAVACQKAARRSHSMRRYAENIERILRGIT